METEMEEDRHCVVCMKLSDASVRVFGVWLCGTHYDAWLGSHERESLIGQTRTDPFRLYDRMVFADWARRVAAEERNGSRKAGDQS
jgi:hypothetical protein